MNELVFSTVAAALSRGETVALVTVVATSGSTPQRAGARMVVFPDGRTVGTIGGGCYEHDACLQARDAIRTRRPRMARYDLDDEAAADTGLICGGRMEVYVEPVEPSPHLFIVGAGHISVALARLACEVGFTIHVVDNRAKSASAERFPAGTDVVVEDIPAWLERTTLPGGAFVVIVTRGHRDDLAALAVLLPREVSYLGMIGSRHKVGRLFDAVKAGGADPARLARVFAPVGFDLGAVTPAEIAVSILAEMLAVRSGRIANPDVAGATLRAKGRPEGPDAGSRV